MCNRTKNKNKKQFFKYCLQCFSSKNVLAEHKEFFLKINGKQTVRSINGSIKIKNHFKQLETPLKIFVDFECITKRVKGNDKNNNTSYTKKDQDHIPCIFAYKVVCVHNNFNKPVVLYWERMQFIDSLKQFLKSVTLFGKNDKKSHLIKNQLHLQKMKKGFRQVISAGYVINHLMLEITK